MKGEALTLAPYEQLLIAVLVLLVTVKIVYSLYCIHRGALSYRLEVRRAGSALERKHWKRQLRIYYLSCLPFISPERAKAICELFYRGRHHDKTGNVHLSAILAPTVSGILLSMACLFSLTFAWFTASTQSTLPKISAASYKLSQTVTVKTSENEAAAVGTTVSEGENGAYTLKKGVTYEIALKVTDDSTATSGFGKIVDYHSHGVLYTTEPIKKGTADFSFTLTPKENVTVCFYASWGKPPSDNVQRIKNGDSIGNTDNIGTVGAENGSNRNNNSDNTARLADNKGESHTAVQKKALPKKSTDILGTSSASSNPSKNTDSKDGARGSASKRSAAESTQQNAISSSVGEGGTGFENGNGQAAASQSAESGRVSSDSLF